MVENKHTNLTEKEYTKWLADAASASASSLMPYPSTITTPYTSTTYPPIAPPYQSTENYGLSVYSIEDTFPLSDCEDLTTYIEFIAMKLGVLQAKAAKEMLIQYGTGGLSKFTFKTEYAHVDDDITITVDVVYKDIQPAYIIADASPTLATSISSSTASGLIPKTDKKVFREVKKYATPFNEEPF